MNIEYTESGKQELNNALENKKIEIEQRIMEMKYVYGDEKVEITASDIRMALENNTRVYYIAKKRSLTKMLITLYGIIGLLSIIVGIFYKEIIQISFTNPIQLAILLIGVVLSLISVIYSIYQKEREQISKKEINNIKNI
jgi:hypothetical protein